MSTAVMFSSRKWRGMAMALPEAIAGFIFLPMLCQAGRGEPGPGS